MSRSRFLSITSSVALGLVACCGNSKPKPDAPCGPNGAPAVGLVASSTNPDLTLTYGNLTAGANNDCPDPSAPAGVVSLTISGPQTDGAGLVTMCIGRPDLLPQGLTLGFGTDAGVQLIDFDGSTENGCTYSLVTTPPTGTVSAGGECDNGAGSAGFSLTVSGTVTLMETCGPSTGTVTAALGGTVAISASAQ